MSLLLKLLIIWFSVPLVLYAMVCLKYKKFKRIEYPDGLKTIFLAPIMIVMLIWENL